MKERSIKCGKTKCKHYDSNSPSKCDMFDDRWDCMVSVEQRRKNRAHSKRQQEIRPNWQ